MFRFVSTNIFTCTLYTRVDVYIYMNMIGEADRSSARHGRVRVRRARVVWFLLDTFIFN